MTEHPERPPELVAATDRPIELVGDPVSVVVEFPQRSRQMLADAVVQVPEREGQRLYLNVEDISAVRNPGVVYGVFLDRPSDLSLKEADEYHIGNIALFGIEQMNDPDTPHESTPGFRHTFDVTELVGRLDQRGEWDPQQIDVSFEVLLPEPPAEADQASDDTLATIVSEQQGWAQDRPVVIGRVSLFVAPPATHPSTGS